MLRRSVAQQFCDAGLVIVNGLPAKSSREIKTGDEIEIRRRDRVTEIRVSHLPPGKQVSKQEAASLYEVISETEITDDLI